MKTRFLRQDSRRTLSHADDQPCAEWYHQQCSVLTSFLDQAVQLWMTSLGIPWLRATGSKQFFDFLNLVCRRSLAWPCWIQTRWTVSSMNLGAPTSWTISHWSLLQGSTFQMLPYCQNRHTPKLWQEMASMGMKAPMTYHKSLRL